MEKRRTVIINTLYFLIIVGGGYIFGVYLLPVFMPFLVAGILAVGIHAVAGRIAVRTERGRKWVAIGVTALFFLGIALLLCLVVVLVFRLGEKAIVHLPRLYEEEFVPWIYSIADTLEKRYGGDGIVGFQNIGDSFMGMVQKMGESLSEISMDKVTNVSAYAKKIPPLVIKVIMTVIATFFLTSDYEKICEFVWKLLPEKGRKLAVTVKEHVFEVLAAYLKSYSILMLLTFIELCIGLGILRIPYFFVISIGIALFDILPVLGTGGILIPWALAAVVLGNYRLAVGLVVLNVVISVIRNILEPRIVGKQIGVHPLATLIALFVGLKVCGVVGMIGFPVGVSILVQLGREGVLGKRG